MNQPLMIADKTQGCKICDPCTIHPVETMATGKTDAWMIRHISELMQCKLSDDETRNMLTQLAEEWYGVEA